MCSSFLDVTVVEMSCAVEKEAQACVVWQLSSSELPDMGEGQRPSCSGLGSS